jgi:4-azaleucine resistance transporter AzlC
LAASITRGLAVGVFGVAFGVLAVTSGLSVIKASAISLLVFTGASQFAAVNVIATGGSPLAALASALLLAARNGAYGLVLAPILGHRRTSTKVVAAQVVVDESTAMAVAQHDRREQERAFWATGVSIFIAWNIGTVLGAVGGSAIGDPETLGLDAAFPAGFLALLVPHLRRRDGRMAALLGGTIALVLIPFTPAGVPILAAGLAAFVGLRNP